MPEVGLGIGRGRYLEGGVEREALYWYDERGKRYLTSEEQLARYRERFGELPEWGRRLVSTSFLLDGDRSTQRPSR